MKRWGALALTTVLAVGCFGGPAHADDVNVAPTARLSGNQTGLGTANGVAVDAAGARYVVTDDSLLVFGPGQTGNVVPTRTIKGNKTKLTAAQAVAVAPGGRVWVANGTGPGAQLLAFGPSATGNVAPVVKVEGADTTLDWPSGLAVDAGGGLYVANRGADAVLYFGPGASGNVAPSRTITGPATGIDAPVGLAIAPSGALHVANSGNGSVTTYVGANNGPVQQIAGPATGLSAPYALAVDAQGYIYVTNRAGGSASVVVLTPPPSGGNTAPSARLIGATTEIDDPTGVAVDPLRQVVVADQSAALTFAPLIAAPPPVPPLPPGPTLLAPSAVNDLTVKGQTTAKKRKVVWKAPTSTGGAPILDYQVTVMKGTKTLFAKRVSGFKVVLKRKKLAVGKLTVTVTAFNSVGQGKRTTKTFKVEKPGTTKKK